MIKNHGSYKKALCEKNPSKNENRDLFETQSTSLNYSGVIQ